MKALKLSPISLTRFNALGGYARHPMTSLYLEELNYFEAEGGDVLGISTMDVTDQDFGGIVLARDGKLRFRGVGVTGFRDTPAAARRLLYYAMRKAAKAQTAEHHQGDEKGAPVDFFTHIHDEARLNPAFVQLTTNEGYSPARAIIEPMMRWYEDADGNFVEQFQTTGFDQRIWELYLFATLIEANFTLNRDKKAPDFCCSSVLGELYIEALTVGPTTSKGKIVPPPPQETPPDREAYLKEYMPIKFGSALYSKLQKKYWTQPHVTGKPFVLAIADFSAPMSMVHTQSALERYLFGYEHIATLNAEGKLVIAAERIRVETQFGAHQVIAAARQTADRKMSARLS